jgi:hypothetical protein
MHPEIKKFWNDSGYDVMDVLATPVSMSDLDTKYYWLAYSYIDLSGNTIIPKVIGLTLNNGNNLYYLGSYEKVSEEVALRMIGLKSFL